MNADNPHPLEKSRSYTAYLIRLWKDSQAGEWRASAQSVQGQEAVRFATLHDLFTFLLERTEGVESESK